MNPQPNMPNMPNMPNEAESFTNLMKRHIDVSQRLASALIARNLTELERCMEEQRLLAFELKARASVADPSIRALAQIVKDLNRRNARLIENAFELSQRLLKVMCPPVTYALPGQLSGSNGFPSSSGISLQG
jgi:flagellar biosynthesis/type III secretory pathway chaperone